MKSADCLFPASLFFSKAQRVQEKNNPSPIQSHVQYLAELKDWEAVLQQAILTGALRIRTSNGVPILRLPLGVSEYPGHAVEPYVSVGDFCDYVKTANIPYIPTDPDTLAVQMELIEPGEVQTQAETQEERQRRRYQAAISAGLTMPNNDYAPMPRGIGKLASNEGITRQAFTQDLKAHIRRMGTE
ncbi:MAG: hypothetical protein WCH44_06475 [Betaproteobacteria bacterium]